MASTNISYDQSAAAVHNRLFFRLFQAGNTLDRQSVNELGITTVQWATLGALSRPKAAEGMSFSELTDYLLVSRQSLDGLLKRLEAEGHVQRVIDPADRRAKKVVLLPAGRKFWEEIQPKIYEFYRQAVEKFRFDDKAPWCTTSTCSTRACRQSISAHSPKLKRNGRSGPEQPSARCLRARNCARLGPTYRTREDGIR